MADQEAMYCHACHYHWHRDDGGIDCPACMSSSTEIITPDNDPRDFHNRQQEVTRPAAAPVAPEPVPAQGADASSPGPAQNEPSLDQAQNSNGATNINNDENPRPANGPLPRATFRFNTSNTPQVAFVTFVTPNMAASPPPPSATGNQPAMTFFGIPVQFTTPFTIPQTAVNNNAPSAEANHNNYHQHQQRPHEQPPPIGPYPATSASPGQQSQQEHDHAPHPHPGPMMNPGHILATILSTFLNNPASPGILGDAVFSDDALDHIITQLREQAAPGGAPPASQAALERLQMKQIDEGMLDREAKCVVCVDDMVKGEQAAVLPCAHFFHGECVMPWLKMHGTCPVCRRSVEVSEQHDGEGVEKRLRPEGRGNGNGDQEGVNGDARVPVQGVPQAAAGSGNEEGLDGMDCS